MPMGDKPKARLSLQEHRLENLQTKRRWFDRPHNALLLRGWSAWSDGTAGITVDHCLDSAK